MTPNPDTQAIDAEVMVEAIVDGEFGLSDGGITRSLCISVARRAIQAAKEQQNEWRPIDSAPRDGTCVLLFAPGWKAASTAWTFGNDEWQDCPYHHGGNPAWKPTHWRPLPSPPKGDTP
jgi:hypothetical protein